MSHVLTAPPTPENLAPRTLDELSCLCRALVIPHTGSKEKLRERILKAWDLRTILQEVVEPLELVEKFKARELYLMCKTAGIFKGGTKKGKAAGLLNWRNECRSKGQKWLSEQMDTYTLLRCLRYWGPI